MPIQTYSDLQSAVGDFLNRQDLTAVIPTLIQFAESDFNRTLRVLPGIVWDTTLGFSSALAPLPADFLEMKGSPYIPGTVSLKYRTPEAMNELAVTNAPWWGYPNFYTILGRQMKIYPIAAPGSPLAPAVFTTLTFSYYQRITALSQPTDVNWVLATYPDLYLYSSLVHSAPYLKDDDRVQVWNAFRTQLLADIHEEDERASYRGATPRISISVQGGSIG